MAANRDKNHHFVTRRILLGTLSCAAVLSGTAWGQDAPVEQPPATPPVTPVAKDDPGRPFSFDSLSEEMRHSAENPDKGLALPDSFLNQLNYDAYKLIRFDPKRARFDHIDNTRFLLQAFHMGWLYSEPVRIYEVADGNARLMGFDTDDFIYEREARDIVPEHVALPGVAGFRLHTPLNRPDVFDELVAFQGASYFRALGRYSTYGLSARGLAVNTGMPVAEEFPRFTRFWVSRPQSGSNVITVWASMESASLTGAYQFIITPGQNTQMDVTARLFFRSDVQQLGIAPLTSMFLYNEMNRTGYDDYRPQVHDNDGLGIIRADGERVWRPLANPPRLASSYFVEQAPKSFGLYQRDRDYESYQDPGATYERRPSCRVEPTSDWGKGMVRLVEIPSNYEVNDNIVVFWVPERGAKAGDMHEYSYRLNWGDLPPDAKETHAYVAYSSSGIGGVSGIPNTDGSHKFVVDFKGGLLHDLAADKSDDLNIVATATRAEIVTQVLHKVDQDGTWRAVIDVRPEKGATVELSLYIAGYERKLSETWLYQWMPA